MKKVLFTLFALLCIHAVAKGLSFFDHNVGAHDYFEVNVPFSFLQGGTCQTWNFCDLEQGFSKRMEIFLDQDSCMNLVFDGNFYIYKDAYYSLDLIRQEQPTYWLAYSQPIKNILPNSFFGSRDSCVFKAKGKYCEKNILTKKGILVEKVDADGIAILANSDTLNNINRHHGIITSVIEIFEDSTDKAKPILLQEKEEYFHWYIKDFFLPILLLYSKTLLKDGNQILYEKSAYLMDIKGKNQILEKKHQREIKNVQSLNQKSSPITSHTVSYNNESKELCVSIIVNRPIKVTLLVSTTNGVLMLHSQIYCENVTTNEAKLDCSTLPKGQYVVFIQSGKYVESKKFIIQ